MGSTERLSARATGRVQGVGYRFFTLSAGRRLGLKGYARNCPDGSVEVVAEGSRDRLLQLLAELRRGPAAAQVDAVTFDFAPPTGEFTEFGVRS